MWIRKLPHPLKARPFHERFQGLKLEIDNMLRSFERRPASAHALTQYTANVRRSDNNVTARLGSPHDFRDKAERLVDMLDHLGCDYAIELSIQGNLFSASH